MGYPVEMKEVVLKKVLMGGKAHKEIAKEAGIGLSTLAYWLKHYKKDGKMNLSSKLEKRPNDWSGEERFNALIATGVLSEVERVEWCRKEGVFTHHLDQWKKDAMCLLIQNDNSAKGKDVVRLKRENCALKKELLLKDKALAETAALLILKKKANSIWGEFRVD